LLHPNPFFMKHLLIALLLLTATATFAQTQNKLVPHYLQLTAKAFDEDDIVISIIRQPTWKVKYYDTCINIDSFNRIIKAVRYPTNVLNTLARDGWMLVSTATMPGGGVVHVTYIIYYLKKDFEH